MLAIVASGSDGDVQRAVENHRGMGVGTVVALRGGTPDNGALDSVSNGSIIVDGTQYDALNLAPANTGTAKATALSLLIADSGVVVRWVREQYLAFYQWRPTYTAPVFGDVTSSSVAEDFGLLPDDVTAPAGPFMRTTAQDLTITAAVTRRGAFPGDGLDQMRAALTADMRRSPMRRSAWSAKAGH